MSKLEKHFKATLKIAAQLDDLAEKMKNKKPELGQWRYPPYDDTLRQFCLLNKEYDRQWAKILKIIE